MRVSVLQRLTRSEYASARVGYYCMHFLAGRGLARWLVQMLSDASWVPLTLASFLQRQRGDLVPDAREVGQGR